MIQTWLRLSWPRLKYACTFNWEFHKTEKFFKRALELNPNLSLAHYQYAWTLFLFGRNDEAIVEHELAWKCDPFNPAITAFLGALYSYVGRYEDAIQQAHKSFEIIKDFPLAYFVLGETYLAMGRADEAIAAHQKLAELVPPWGWFLGYTYAVTGHRDEAFKVLEPIGKSRIKRLERIGTCCDLRGAGQV